jgi:predicted dehydrogenase
MRLAQIGTRHGHAAGKWQALQTNADVEAIGIWEPHADTRAAAQQSGAFGDARWFESQAQVLEDPGIMGVAIEGRNHESLAMATAALQAGKHLWFDKPAGDDWAAFVSLMDDAAVRKLHIQMGYMFRYSPGFATLSEYARSGQLGDIFALRAHMSTSIPLAERTEQSRHRGGILYDLGGHVIDQIVWLLGRPARIHSVLRNDATPELPDYADNTVAVFEFGSAVAVIDIAAMEPTPTARRFEVYGTRGSAIIEPFDPVRTFRLATDGMSEHVTTLTPVSRQELYARELAAFVGVVRHERPPNRSAEHELLVQETLLRATGRLGAS